MEYINNIKRYVDLLDMDNLYFLCCTSPDKFFTYISPRYLGKKRLDKLRVYLMAQDDQIPDRHFLKILLSRCEKFSGEILFL